MVVALAVLLACSVAGESTYEGGAQWVRTPEPSEAWAQELEELCGVSAMQRAASSRAGPGHAPTANPARDPRCEHYQAARLLADQGRHHPSQHGQALADRQDEYEGSRPRELYGAGPHHQRGDSYQEDSYQDEYEGIRPREFYGGGSHHQRQDSYQVDASHSSTPRPRPHFLYGGPARHPRPQPSRRPLTGEEVCESRNPDRRDQQLCAALPCCRFHQNPLVRGSGRCWSAVGAGRCIPPECPAAAPELGSPCGHPAGEECSYGRECCCGHCHPSLLVQCSEGRWVGRYSDACLHPNCPNTGEPEPCPQTCELTAWPLCQCLTPATYSDQGKGNCNVGALQTDLQVWCYLDPSLGSPLAVCPDARPSESKPGYYWSRFACITEIVD